MPTFSNSLPDRTKHTAFTLRRTPADKPLLAIATSADIVCCDTHYWGGRTTPHEDENCPACTALQPRRTHVYLSALDVKTREHFIFELTAHAATVLVDYRDRNGTLRGCYFCATRPQRTKSGRVLIETRPADLSKINLPNPPDLCKALCIIWQVPGAPGARSTKPRSHARPGSNPGALAQMREPPANAPDPAPISDSLAAAIAAPMPPPKRTPIRPGANGHHS